MQKCKFRFIASLITPELLPADKHYISYSTKATEGESAPTIVVVRWEYIGGIKAEVVSVRSCGVRTQGPAVAVLAEVPETTNANIDIPAAHGG